MPSRKPTEPDSRTPDRCTQGLFSVLSDYGKSIYATAGWNGDTLDWPPGPLYPTPAGLLAALKVESWIELAPSGVFRTNGEKYWLEKTRRNLQLVLITLNGLKLNIWSEGLVDVSLSAEEIFGSLH